MISPEERIVEFSSSLISDTLKAIERVFMSASLT